ncbi:MAG: hypothetical protein LBQ60_01545 [Bacteroidales bacterium]|nr:hypothetical protein [Bacteroidales bacterium]
MKSSFNHSFYILLLSIAFLSACNTEEDPPYDNSDVFIEYDQYMVPRNNIGAYLYSDLDDQVKVRFRVNADASSVKVRLMKKGEEEYGPETEVIPVNQQCELTYTISELNWTGEDDEAMVKVTNGPVSKEIVLTTVPCWISLDNYKYWEVLNLIFANKTFTPIQGKSINDTINFMVSVDEWIDMNQATWDVVYTVGINGVEQNIPLKVSASKKSASCIFSMKNLAFNPKDTVFIYATVTNKGVSRMGDYAFIVSDLTPAFSSEIEYAESFAPAISKIENDTIMVTAIVKKSINYREWLDLTNATWSYTYSVGAKGAPSAPIPVSTDNIENDETMSVAKFVNIFGSLSGVAQYDTLFINSVMEIDGNTLPVKYSFQISK